MAAHCEDLQVLLSGPADRVLAEIVNLAGKIRGQTEIGGQEDIKLSVGRRTRTRTHLAVEDGLGPGPSKDLVTVVAGEDWMFVCGGEGGLGGR